MTNQPTASGVSEEMIKHMVNRFLCWKLPKEFHPDAGISFEPEFNKEWNAKRGQPPQRHEPSGTNLFDATQAEAMVRYMVEGSPFEAALSATRGGDDLLRNTSRALRDDMTLNVDDLPGERISGSFSHQLWNDWVKAIGDLADPAAPPHPIPTPDEAGMRLSLPDIFRVLDDMTPQFEETVEFIERRHNWQDDSALRAIRDHIVYGQMPRISSIAGSLKGVTNHSPKPPRVHNEDCLLLGEGPCYCEQPDAK